MNEQNNVLTPPQILEHLRDWAYQAKAAGCGGDFLAALKIMRHRLLYEADSWGDPLYDYHTIQGVQCRGMIANWFLVWYSFHPATRTVYVREIILAPGCPLE